MHPLITDTATLKTSEIEAKVSDLTKKYFMTNNYQIQSQISAVLDVYREELARRQAEEWEKVMESRNKGLDKLINVS